MSGVTFPSPTADEAELSRIHYELEYTEGISQRMRIPDTLKVAPENQQGAQPKQPLPPHSTLMQVPERIVIAGKKSSVAFSVGGLSGGRRVGLARPGHFAVGPNVLRCCAAAVHL